MKGVRIEVAHNAWLVDITCDCGRNGLMDVMTGTSSFKHRLPMLVGSKIVLKCSCRRQFAVRSQTNHVHVDELSALASDVIDVQSTAPVALVGDQPATDIRLLNPAS